MASTSNVIVTVMIFAVMLAKQVQATKHIVGGSQGWDESSDFSSWASAQTFKVGDELVFKYTPGLHSVVELAETTAYKNCDVSTALDSKSSGEDVIKLTKAGTRYFACGTLGHCGGGMKLKITTVASSSSSTTATPTSSDDSQDSSSSSSTPSTSSTNTISGAPIHLRAYGLPILAVVFINIILINA
ncbi:unnamed protein product [Rhodiola kirilowii]